MSHTSQPSRRELYLIAQEQPPTTDPTKSAETEPPTGGFFVPKTEAS